MAFCTKFQVETDAILMIYFYQMIEIRFGVHILPDAIFYLIKNVLLLSNNQNIYLRLFTRLVQYLQWKICIV